MNEEEIFHQALARNPKERAAYLEQACAGDPALRAAVGALLRANVGATGFLGQPAPALVATADEPPLSEGPGAVIGPYKLLEQIGEGGFGVVFLAEQQRPVRRKVALKVLKPGMDTRQVVARFEAERQALALMDHPNIAKVFDGGATASGRPYFVMELVKGVPVTDFCDRNHLTPRQRLGLFVSVCQAVQHAHQKGIIHRDLKPSNVLVTLHDTTPVVKVIDFGVAKAMGQELTDKTLFTGFAQMVGTPLYMSPEQAGMSGLDVDTRSDIYALGVLLYELLTGTTPFDRERFKRAAYDEIRRIIREEEPPRPSTRLSESTASLPSVSAQRRTEAAKLTKLVRGELDWIVMKCLEKDRNRRYETANALALDLLRYLHDEPVQACPPSAAYRFRKFARRQKGVLATAALALVALVAVVALVVGSSFTMRLQVALDDAQKARSAEEVQRHKAERFQYGQHISLANHAWQENYTGRLEQLLDQCPADSKRSWEWRYLKRQCHPELLTLRGHTAGIARVIFSKDGTRVATGSLDGTVRVWDAVNGREVAAIPAHHGDVMSVAFSPDERRIASAGSDRTVKVWDVQTRQLLLTLEGHQSDVYGLAYSPDGRWLASGSFDKTIRVWDPVTGTLVRTLEGHTAEVCSLVASPDGRRLVSGGFDRTLRLWDVAAGRELGRFEGLKPAVTFSMALSPDGRRLASPSRDNTVKVWDVESRRLLHTLVGHKDEVNCAAFSPDGKWIASSGADNTVLIWDAATGRPLAARRGHSNYVFDVAFSPDGGRVASSSQDRTVRLWPGPATPDADLLVGHSDEVAGVAFSPDGRRMATASRDQTVKVWDTVTRQAILTLKGHSGPVAGVAFGPDGTWLVSAGADRRLICWDLVSGLPTRTLAGHGAEIRCVTVSPDGKRIASGDADGWVRGWDAATGAELLARKAHDGEVRNLAFDAAGSQLASSGADRVVQVWDTAAGRSVQTLDGHHCWVHAVAFSPDLTRFAVTGLPEASEGAGRPRLATGSGDGTAMVWDLATGQNLFPPIEAHSGFVYGVAFAPDGSRFATAGSEGTVKLWDGETGAEVLTLKGAGGVLYAVAFSPDGSRLAAASSDGTVQVWDARPASVDGQLEREALGALEALFARPLCRADAREHLGGLRTVRPEARQSALALVDRYREESNPDVYYQAGWSVARQGYLNPLQYAFALRQAETACRLAPARAEYRTALGAAQYRTGNDHEAVRTLQQAGQPDSAAPTALAFWAMSQYRLGQKEQARAALARVRQGMSQPPWSRDETAQAVLHEAEALVQGNGGGARKLTK
jgi:WD40 repeat protein/serine/threonine protein kinase/Flp pilus assembly protein TadD